MADNPSMRGRCGTLLVNVFRNRVVATSNSAEETHPDRNLLRTDEG